jgi:predicted amidohydrolase/GNAT superfamily N-acetyltransferase
MPLSRRLVSRTAATPPEEPRIRVRPAREEDIPVIEAVQKASYPGFPPTELCDERHYHFQIEVFPEGQLVAVDGDRVVGYAMSLIVQLDDDSPWYSYAEITGDGTFSTHDPAGDTLYGADIAVDPEYRGRGVARLLYVGRKRILQRFNLRRMVAGGRIPGYQAVAHELTAEEYVKKVTTGELFDPALTVHLRAGYEVRGVYKGYVEDEPSCDHATFLELENPEYRPAQRKIAASPMKRPVRRIRVCAAQYQQRTITSWEEFENQVGFFVETAEVYHSHFLLLPELFTVQLFSLLDPRMSPRDAIAALARMTDRYLEMFTGMAQRSGLFIVAGTHPVSVGEEIRNVAHLFTPAGQVYTQDKLHITPDEREEYGIEPGHGLHVFDTGHARIAIVVCYDIEFPELCRLLTLAGAEVVFVPFSTDERKAYLRVRYSAQARAVENTIYTVLAGNVGNLPNVENFLINYGQAAIFTPSDFQFPPDGIAAVADSNTETVVITDLDLVSLEEAREMGSVRPLRDRRLDLYHLEATTPVQIVRTR